MSCLVWCTVRADAILTDNLIYLPSSMSVYAVNERALSCCLFCAMGKTVVIGCRGKYITLFIGVLGCDVSSFWTFSDTSSFVYLTAVVSGLSQLKCIFLSNLGYPLLSPSFSIIKNNHKDYECISGNILATKQYYQRP